MMIWKPTCSGSQTRAVLLAVTLLGLTACRRDVNVNVEVDTTASEAPPPAPAETPDAPPPAEGPESPPESPSGAVSEEGFGAVRVGMTREAAERALGPVEPGLGVAGESCRYLNPTGAPSGVMFMVVDNVVARVDVSPYDMSVEVPAARLPRTAAGLGVGSTQAEVEAAYGARMRPEPHHYTDGRYLVVTPQADTTRRIIFETDAGGRVTSIRAGRQPEVGWIEGCS